MMLKKTLMLTASASAIALGGAHMAMAQANAMDTGAFDRDETQRLRSETAELYASSIAKLTEVIEKDIREDAGTTVISNLRAGRISALPSLDSETLGLIRELQINAIVIDADPGADVDERILVFVRDGDLKQGVTRADIEREAELNRYAALVRLQNGTVTGRDGAFDIPASTPASDIQGVGSWIGVSGNDKITSGDNGSKEVRVLACEAGFYGTGITQERDIQRITDLGGNATDSFSGWTEVARDCSPEYSEQVRYFDVCAGADGVLGTADDGQALYEATQYVRQSPSDPFETEVWRDDTTATLVDDAECLTGDRVSGSADFLVDGQADGPRELQLKTATTPGDVGNGPGTVPEEVNAAGGAGPVSGIPFPAGSLSDFQYTRTCTAEYGNVGLPAGFSGPATFSGDIGYFRDYNRRETYFSDNRREYILNYDLVLDPNPYGHPAKGRGPIPAGSDAAPGGDGWYKASETCEREITRPEIATRQRACSVLYPSHPNGQVNERRDGTGFYTQTTPDNPAPNGPTRTRIDWGPWYETSNGCYYTTETRTVETRNTQVTVGGQRCQQPQRRVRVVRTNHYQSGGTSSATTFDPNWTNNGGRTNCTTTYSGGGGSDGGGGRDSVDVDGDGRGDFRDSADARANGHPDGGRSVSGGCGACNGPSGGGSSSSGGGGGGGGGGGCFAPDTLVRMADGSEKRIDQIEIGDEIAEGGIVLVLGSFLSDDVYHLDGVRVTATHVVKGDEGWIRVKDHPRAVREIARWQKTCNLITSNNRMICGGVLFADQAEFGGVFLDEVMAQGEEERIAQMNAGPARRAG